MASSSKRHDRARHVAVKKEVFATKDAPFVSGSKATEAEEEEIYHLSSKKFFDVVLSNSHVSGSYTAHMPVTGISMLPRATIPVDLRYGGKTWTMSYSGDSSRPGFDSQWKTFVIDNDLKCGDACVFEKMESSSTNVTFKVHILRDELPPELRKRVDSRGKTADTAIDLD